MRTENDQTLVTLARRGDEDAFARLVERHYQLIFRVAWRWLGARADAEDVTQEVCVKLAGALGSFRGELAFTTWVTRMTINTAHDLMRSRARQNRNVEALALVEVGNCVPALDAGDEAGEVWREVDTLPARQRDAVLLVYGEGMNHAEAAQVLGCREKTLSWHLHEARKALKTRLKD